MATGLITLSRHDEGRPQVMLEAMASGLPVLASDLPAHRDLVQHRQTGWLAPNRDELVKGLTWLEDPLHNQSTGRSARQWVKDSIGTWDDCADRYAAAYRRLLEPLA
jgi:glycosyltransferase involved in cell wall biosynthesis